MHLGTALAGRGLLRLGSGLTGLPLQLVQLRQPAAQGLALLSVHGGDALLQLLLPAALGVLLELLLELLAIPFALLHVDFALFRQYLSGLDHLFGGQRGQSHTSEGHICQCFAKVFPHNSESSLFELEGGPVPALVSALSIDQNSLFVF